MDNVNPITREEKILSGEDLQPRTRMEYFLKKASENGGSGLPDYGIGDENKALTVKRVIDEIIWAPEQIIEVSNEYAYDVDVNFDQSDLRVGLEATAVFTIFGTDMSIQCYVVDDPTYGLMWEDENQTAQLYLDPESNKWTIHANEFPDGTYTGKFVSTKDKGVVPTWSGPFVKLIDFSSMQDVVMEIPNEDGSGTTTLDTSRDKVRFTVDGISRASSAGSYKISDSFEFGETECAVLMKQYSAPELVQVKRLLFTPSDGNGIYLAEQIHGWMITDSNNVVNFVLPTNARFENRPVGMM